jgi:hypothetical protein
LGSQAYNTSAFDAYAILERAGFEIRRNRAFCPYCRAGHHRPDPTVAIFNGRYYCHRCKASGTIRSLARQQGVELPPPRIRKADIPKQRFRAWLATKCREMATLEYRLYQKVKFARVCLNYYPQHEGAWDALRQWYDAQHQFEIFWESAGDKVGRFYLYRAWRHANA